MTTPQIKLQRIILDLQEFLNEEVEELGEELKLEEIIKRLKGINIETSL